MENKMFVSKNDWQDVSLTNQVCAQAGHCLLISHYFQPWLVTTQQSLTIVSIQECSTWYYCCKM